MVRRTPQERSSLVKQWRESGKTMSAWCREHQIPITTFCGWAYKKASSMTRGDFTELKEETSCTGVLIKWRGCKIHMDHHNAPLILEKCLSVIGRYQC